MIKKVILTICLFASISVLFADENEPITIQQGFLWKYEYSQNDQQFTGLNLDSIIGDNEQAMSEYNTGKWLAITAIGCSALSGLAYFFPIYSAMNDEDYYSIEGLITGISLTGLTAAFGGIASVFFNKAAEEYNLHRNNEW